MTTAILDLAGLSVEQLHAVALTLPQLVDSVKDELERRKAYPELADGFADLALVVAKVEAFLENTRRTESVRAFVAMGVPDVLKRVLITARIKGHEYSSPTLEQLKA